MPGENLFHAIWSHSTHCFASTAAAMMEIQNRESNLPLLYNCKVVSVPWFYTMRLLAMGLFNLQSLSLRCPGPAKLSDNLSRVVLDNTADMLLSSIVNVVHGMQYMVRKCHCIFIRNWMVNQRFFFFSIDFLFFKLYFLLRSDTYPPSCDFYSYCFRGIRRS